MTLRQKLWIIQPYLPSYRVPFFNGLREQLAERFIDMRVIAGTPTGEQAARGDSSTAEWCTLVASRPLRLGGVQFNLSSSHRVWRDGEGVIVPLMGSSADTNLACLTRRKRRVGVWGHVDSYTGTPNSIDLSIEKWQMQRADQVFAYTPGGAKFAISRGIDPAKVTTVMNSLDTNELLSDYARAMGESGEGVDNSRDDRYYAYIGGLDGTKQVALLAETLDHLYRGGTPIHVKVAGEGPETKLLRDSVSRGQVSLLGFVSGMQKARLLAHAKGILNPGRIGLVAVDSLVTKTPIFTTRFAFHAPEAEYLKEGLSMFTSDNTAEAYARMLSGHDASGRDRSDDAWAYPSLDDMVENFTGGVVAMLRPRRDLNT